MTTDRLRGVWAAIPTPWTRAGTVDTGVVRELVQRYHAAGLNGAYTTGTDGEMHVLEWDDFRALVDTFAEATIETGLPAQVGCTWHHTDGVIKRARYARERGIPRIQVALPGWVPLNDSELLAFFGALQTALPDVELIHYNIATSGRFLTGDDYRSILEVAPSLRGSKHTGGNVSSLIEIIQATPELAHFVVDHQIMPGALLGAKGFYSFVSNLNPEFSVELWRACEHGDWERAAAMRIRLEAFFAAWRALTKDITASPALAKIATAAGILPEMPLAVRPPYQSGTAEHIGDLRRLLAREFPDLAMNSSSSVRYIRTRSDP